MLGSNAFEFALGVCEFVLRNHHEAVFCSVSSSHHSPQQVSMAFGIGGVGECASKRQSCEESQVRMRERVCVSVS